MTNPEINKITVVGNIAGGKTTLSLKLVSFHELPLTHIDSIQFLPGMKIRPLNETRTILQQITQQKKWLIDGYGPFDLLEQRFQLSDRIVFIDLPIWRHFFWLGKRQLKSMWKKRNELPEGCDEFTLEHSLKLVRTLWEMHSKMRPELIRIFNRDQLRPKMIFINSIKEWNDVLTKGLK